MFANNVLMKLKKRDIKTNKKNTGYQDEPLKILKLRYAKGEITKEQYEQMKQDLEK